MLREVEEQKEINEALRVQLKDLLTGHEEELKRMKEVTNKSFQITNSSFRFVKEQQALVMETQSDVDRKLHQKAELVNSIQNERQNCKSHRVSDTYLTAVQTAEQIISPMSARRQLMK